MQKQKYTLTQLYSLLLGYSHLNVTNIMIPTYGTCPISYNQYWLLLNLLALAQYAFE